MASVGLGQNQADADGSDNEMDWEALLQELQTSKDMSYAEVNAKRKQLTFRSFSDTTLPIKLTILEIMIEPNIQLMTKLFKRSGQISSLYHLPKSETVKRSELMDTCLGPS